MRKRNKLDQLVQESDYKTIVRLRREGCREAIYFKFDEAGQKSFEKALEELNFQGVSYYTVLAPNAAFLFVTKETAGILGIPTMREAAKKVLKTEPEFQELAKLRKDGYSEVYFPVGDEFYDEEYTVLMRKLSAIGADHRVVEVQNTRFVFMKPETAVLLGAQVRRNEAEEGVSAAED